MELGIQKQSYEGIFKRGVLKNFAKWKHLCQSFSLTQLQTVGTYIWISSSFSSNVIKTVNYFHKNLLDPKCVSIVNNSNFNFKINNKITRKR